MSYPCPKISLLSISLSPGRSSWEPGLHLEALPKATRWKDRCSQGGNEHYLCDENTSSWPAIIVAWTHCLLSFHSKLFWFKGILRFPRFFRNFFKIVMTLFHEICCNFLELLGLANFLEINSWYCVDGFSRNA